MCAKLKFPVRRGSSTFVTLDLVNSPGVAYDLCIMQNPQAIVHARKKFNNINFLNENKLQILQEAGCAEADEGVARYSSAFDLARVCFLRLCLACSFICRLV